MSVETSSHTLISHLHAVQYDLPSYASDLHDTHIYWAKMEIIQRAIQDQGKDGNILEGGRWVGWCWLEQETDLTAIKPL